MFLLVSFNSKRDRVKIMPGVGIIINTDTILIKKTTPEQLLAYLKLEDNFHTGFRHSDGFDSKTGQSVYSDDLVKNIIYKEIDFEFTGKVKDSLKLMWIRIKANSLLDVCITESIKLGQRAPTIDNVFKKVNNHDYIAKDSLTYNLYSQGISFHFKKVRRSRKITEVSVHYIIEGKKK
jgi:hypothetical protein